MKLLKTLMILMLTGTLLSACDRFDGNKTTWMYFGNNDITKPEKTDNSNTSNNATK